MSDVILHALPLQQYIHKYIYSFITMNRMYLVLRHKGKGAGFLAKLLSKLLEQTERGAHAGA